MHDIGGYPDRRDCPMTGRANFQISGREIIRILKGRQRKNPSASPSKGDQHDSA